MTLELSDEQRTILNQTRVIETPAEFEVLRKAAEPKMNAIVREPMEPNKPIATILIELRDLLLTAHQYKVSLAAKSYTDEHIVLFTNSIRLVDTAFVWFGEGSRTGAYRVRSVEEVVQGSRPWRSRIAVLGDHAFVFEPEIADQFTDKNTSGTLDEERSDLAAMNSLVHVHRARLDAVGLTDAHVAEGKVLQEEADGRDLIGVLGFRNREEATTLRNRFLTYAVLLGREARAAGINACYDDLEARRRFEASSFQNALRRLRPRRRGAAAAAGPEGEPEAGGEP